MRLHDFLDYQARERGDGEFAVQGDRRMTYGEALAETNRLANAFINAGLQIGDRLAMLAKNSIEYVLVYFAASKAGVVPVPLNYRLTPAEWSYILNDAGVKVILAAGEYLPTVDSLRHELPTIERFVAIGSARVGWDDYHQWLTEQPMTSPSRFVLEDCDLYQMYTSGTTGHPKGAVLTHCAVVAQLGQVGLALRGEPGERRLLVAPVFHAAAAVGTAFMSVSQGGSLYIQSDFQPHDVLRVLSEEHIVMVQMVPSMIQACLTMVPDAA